MDHEQTTMTRSELARLCSVNAETLRYYEQRGLLPEPERSGSNYRLYNHDDARRIRFVQRAKQLGFTLKEVRELLALSTAAGDTCGDVREKAAAKAKEIDAKMKSLGAMRRTLDELMERCSGDGDLDECPILNSFETEVSP